MKVLVSLIAYGFLSVITLNNMYANDKESWTYTGEKGAENWGKIHPDYTVCETGKVQSPVNIKNYVEADLESIKYNYIKGSGKIIDKGLNFQLNFDSGNTIIAEKKTYELLQIHFHTPSEYHISNEAYPMELHLVHKEKDSNTLAVIGIMFEEGEANTEIEKMFKAIPSGDAKEVTIDNLDLLKLLPKDEKYFRFIGSLTTPPCDEGVNWFVMQQPITASKEQIEMYKNKYKMNARPLQNNEHQLIIKDNK
ncbi:MAG: hypothetical protein BGO27_00270 [Alphaproteobacteria bacterium 33-17]|nr:MAG: hypothetical protein BGO27_00270 [Alphaproteobacteria bacterium 33-17]